MIKRQVLTKEDRTKLNVLPDRDFYSYPRYVKHVDDGFISTLTNLYRERLRPEGEILDLMSSWVSYLPEEVRYKRVVGHGLNAQELSRKSRLEYFVIKDLNQEQRLEFADCSFDAVLCTVSLQYLQQPEKVFAEVFRMLKPGGVFIVSFSNRMFSVKAISSWRDASPFSRVQLVMRYFQCIKGITQPQIIRKLPSSSPEDRNMPFNWFSRFFELFAGGSDPFYALLSYKNFRPLTE